MTTHTDFPELVQDFFTERLLRQRKASPETVAGYRDSFRLLLRFGEKSLKKEPSKLALEELDSPFIGEFLDHLESERSNSIRTRNARLAAIHSFFRYVSFQEPGYADRRGRILAIPSKRYERRPIEYLTREEIDALVAGPDTTTWIGRRDHALLLVGVQTGLRVSELIGLQRQHVVVGIGAHVCCQGKGRKQRCTPLRCVGSAHLKLSVRATTRREFGKMLFPSRVKVKPLVMLSPANGVPMSELKGKVRFFQTEQDSGKFKGFVRVSPALFRPKEDGDFILRLLREAEQSPVARPVDAKKLARKPFFKAERQKGKQTISTVVSVPDSEEAETVEQPELIDKTRDKSSNNAAHGDSAPLDDSRL